jgi:hypothetical protein
VHPEEGRLAFDAYVAFGGIEFASMLTWGNVDLSATKDNLSF